MAQSASEARESCVTFDLHLCFSSSYSEARGKFREAAKKVGGGSLVHRHGLPGAEGEDLSCDALWLGNADPQELLIIQSGVHGVEGYCGSALQTALLESGLWQSLQSHQALFIIHAVNPHGFSYDRRVTEGNVDLNRNFVDFRQRLPINRGYEELRDALCPLTWCEDSAQTWQAACENYRIKAGSAALQAAISAGQYSHAEGLFYGGSQATWSRRCMTSLVRQALAPLLEDQGAGGRKKQVYLVDLHTGLGPFGEGELMAGHLPGEPAAERLEALFPGRVTYPQAGPERSSSSALTGDCTLGLQETFAPEQATGVDWTTLTLEYGTRPLDEVLEALRFENWFFRSVLDGPKAALTARLVRQVMREAFYPGLPQPFNAEQLESSIVFAELSRGFCHSELLRPLDDSARKDWRLAVWRGFADLFSGLTEN